MSREIRFRGKSTDTGEWIFGDLIRHQPSLEPKSYIKSTLLRTMRFAPVERNTVGQFTGLHDKNGVEIYEGDISYIAGTGNCEVSFRHSGWQWENTQHIFPFSDCEEEIIVIGNIYESPELLEAK